MSSILKNKSDLSMVGYLRMVGSDYEESGSECTAEDYREAADRIEALVKDLSHAVRQLDILKSEIPHLEQAAYAAALLDMAQGLERKID